MVCAKGREGAWLPNRHGSDREFFEISRGRIGPLLHVYIPPLPPSLCINLTQCTILLFRATYISTSFILRCIRCKYASDLHHWHVMFCVLERTPTSPILTSKCFVFGGPLDLPYYTYFRRGPHWHHRVAAILYKNPWLVSDPSLMVQVPT